MKKLHAFAAAFFSAALLLSAATHPAAAQTADNLVAGRDYIAIDPPLPVRAPKGKVEILEFFNFSCPHCFRLQGPLAKWKKTHAADIALIHQPVIFQSSGGHWARVLHTLEALGVVGTHYSKVYDAVHRERRLINSKGRFADWLNDIGLDGNRAESIYDSFSINAKIKRDERMMREYGVNSTPQIAVAGKYLLTTGLSGSFENMLNTAALLIAREKAAQS